MIVKKEKKRKIVGRTEYIDLPELGIFNIQAKIDTGAYSCSIHISHAEEILIRGQKILKVYIPKNAHFLSPQQHFQFDEFSLKRVKSSNGITEQRYVVKTRVLLKGKKVKTTFTLSDRSDMKYPILLGRKFLMKRFLVDVSMGI